MIKEINWRVIAIETEGEIRALKHLLNFTKMNLKASRERLKEYKKNNLMVRK